MRILSNALYVNCYIRFSNCALCLNFDIVDYRSTVMFKKFWPKVDHCPINFPILLLFFAFFPLVCEGRLCIRKRCAYCVLEWWSMWMTLTFPSHNSVLLRPVHTSDFCCDFLRLLDVNEWNDCSSPEHSWLVYSLTSVSIGEKRTRNCSEIVRVNGSLKSYSVKFIWIFCC